MHLNNLDISIWCGGRALPEYAVKYEEERTIACYIPSEVGQNFEIRFRDTRQWTSRADGHTLRCAIDGRVMGGSLCGAGQHGSRWGVRVSETSRQMFTFSPLILTDDDDAPHAGGNENLGTIEIKALRVVQQNVREFRRNDVPRVGPIHEKSKKAGSHCVELGQTRTCSPARRIECQYLDPKGVYAARFVFRYRSRELLLAQGIIVKSEADDAASAPRNNKRRADSSPQRNEGEPSRKRQRNSVVQAKRSSSLIEDARPKGGVTGWARARRTPSQTVKKEPQPSQLSVTYSEIIDLTQDD
ncbi:hypothetical protein WOLCODRAFT_166263 [Wolfiporia cocos MD-104 SS10]|uniref:DUF7918 domain-containing protein n=1 Tax=Wolfiporia cocos (strain MD-104) TaxID=742152 RepID=A0A2H3JFC6_WOLCO|nr:hypothetical protein WOLCODRAFT_166263 [Wolfiporia cocos MD-104 SS10]